MAGFGTSFLSSAVKQTNKQTNNYTLFFKSFMTMDYCIPHMLLFKCLILTEYKTLEYSLSTRLLKKLCVGHHSHISLKDLVANLAPYQHQCTMSKFWIANRPIALGYRISASWGHGFVQSAEKVECLTASLVWVVGLTCFTRRHLLSTVCSC